MTTRLLLLAVLITTAFTTSIKKVDEDRQGAASSHLPSQEFPDRGSVNTGEDSGSESELRRKPRAAPKTPTATRPQCPYDNTPHFCNDRTTLACFCDTIQQCPGGEDEAECGHECPSGQVRCGDEHTCIYLEQRCDGNVDCGNNWDESYCNPTTTPAPPTTTTTTTTTTTPVPTTTTPAPTKTPTTRRQCTADSTGNSTLKYCADGTTFACFCDSIEECPEGEDEKEENCSSDPEASDSLGKGAIAAIVICVLIVVVAAVIGGAVYRKRLGFQDINGRSIASK